MGRFVGLKVLAVGGVTDGAVVIVVGAGDGGIDGAVGESDGRTVFEHCMDTAI